jgi:predicted nucleic acid-binding protein
MKTWQPCWCGSSTAKQRGSVAIRTATRMSRVMAESQMAYLIIGATAVERGSQVATFNKRHFAKIRGLSVVEPK